MSEYKIEKGILIPIGMTAICRSMEVGDSVFIPGKTSGSIGGVIGNVNHSHGHKFTCRNATDNNVKGVRIWRIS